VISDPLSQRGAGRSHVIGYRIERGGKIVDLLLFGGHAHNDLSQLCLDVG
jgi:hypothetical protein